MPVDFFHVTLKRIADILRIWGLKKGLEMNNRLMYILYVFVQHLVKRDPDATMWAL